MKKYLSFFAAALLFAACQSDDIVDQKETTAPKGSIQFGVASTQNLTRTPGKTIGVIGEDNTTLERSIKMYGFGVFGCYTGNNVYENVTVTPDFMYNQKVTLIDGPSTGVYTGVYNPVKYWPNTGKTTFFAYAPYVDHTQIEFEKPGKTHCIAGMSQPGDEGDPWLIYVLSDEPFNPFNGQSDLLIGGQEIQDGSNKYVNPWYNLEKANATDEPMRFTFYHALGIVGDQIKITVTPELKTELSKAENHNAKLYIDHIDMKFKNLTRKAKLILNSKQNVPNWKPIVSGEVTTTREYTITRDDIKTASDKLSTTNHIYSTEDSDFDQTYYNANDGIAVDAIVSDPLLIKTGKGLFYIPYQVAQDPQQVEVTVYYQVLADGMEIFNGEATSTTNLSEHNGKATDIVITLGKNLKYDKIYAPKIGDFYYSDGTWGELNTHEDGALPVGVVGYLGNDIGTYNPETGEKSIAAHGLVIAFEDVAHFDKYADATKYNIWGPSDNVDIVDCNDYTSAYADLNGEYNTNILYNKWVQSNKLAPTNYWAANRCCTYQPSYIKGTPSYGARGTWHIGTMGEWARIWDSLAKKFVNYSGTDIKNAVSSGSIVDGTTFYTATDGTIETSVSERYEAETLGHLGYIFEGIVHRDKFLSGLRYWTSTEVGSNVTTFEIIYSYPIVNNGISFFMNDNKYEKRQIRPLLTF